MTEKAEREFRVALVGCGRIAGNHADAITRIDGLRIVAACDANEERARALAAPLGIPFYSSYEGMLSEVECEAVAICTPSGMHPAQGVMAARAGKHVITEKPMAISLKGADELVQACDAARVHLFVVKQNRLNAPVQLLKRAVDKGRFGRLYMATCRVLWNRPQEYYDQAPWRGTWEFDGGAFMNQGSHYVDLLQWVMGPVESVMAKTATMARKIETEDTGVAILRFRSGALGVIEVTMLTYPRNMEGSVTLLGETGTAKIGGTAVNRVEHWEFAEPDPDDEVARNLDVNPPNVYGYGHEGYYRNVLAVLRGEAKPDTDGRAGRKSLELILGIYESARTGREIALPLKV
ncbi:MAG TPA: Gfo/Idh/MocA family oxidoreductase [Gemmatimonadaceae bacterium]|nr:Gfo/Idh/MocA family oxidoreductase [Gemmatimonadaceae bacterium]